MKTQSHLALGLGLSLILASIAVQAHNDHDDRDDHDRRDHSGDCPQIEPNAGNWKTGVISSGRDYRVPPPPGRRETKTELRQLAEIMSHNTAQTQQQIEFWDAGAPAYRWIDLINQRVLAGTPTTPYPHRVYAYVAQAR